MAASFFVVTAPKSTALKINDLVEPAPIVGVVPIELGVVPSNEARLVLFPLSRVGISESDPVESITTSCDCISATVIDVIDKKVSYKKLLKIEHVPEASGGDEFLIALRVECVVHLQDSTKKSFQIDFESIGSRSLVQGQLTPDRNHPAPEPMALASGALKPDAPIEATPDPTSPGTITHATANGDTP